MKDVAPNVPTIVMGLKDRIAGGNEETPLRGHPEYATPQNIEAFFHGQIRRLDIQIGRDKIDHKDSFQNQLQLNNCQKARNVANAIRLYGPTAFIRQGERWQAAKLAVEITSGKDFDDHGNYLEEKAKENEQKRLHIAAALGHKSSIRRLKTQAEERKNDRQF